MNKQAEIANYNDTFISMIKAGEEKEAAVSMTQFTRNKLREDSFAEKILTPQDISNDELSRVEDPEQLVVWIDREPDTAPAISVPFMTVPEGLQFKGTRYPVYFNRIFSPKYTHDIDKLRGYTYDIRQVMMELSTKEIATEIDTRLIDTVNSHIGLRDTVNPLNGLSLPNYVSISGGLNRTNLKEAMKVLAKMRVPFGPMQPDGSESKGVCLVNNVTMMDILSQDRSEAGGDLSQQMYLEGKPPVSLYGIKFIYTIKRDLVPDNTIYMFSSEDYMGKYLRMQPLTVFAKNEAMFFSWFQYLTIGISFGSSKAMARVDFI